MLVEFVSQADCKLRAPVFVPLAFWTTRKKRRFSGPGGRLTGCRASVVPEVCMDIMGKENVDRESHRC